MPMPSFSISKPILVMSAVGASFGGFILFREMYVGPTYAGKESLNGKTAIVTGANSGIGEQTALELARRKCRVILACRDMEKCQKVRKQIKLETLNKQIICQQCDLASQKSIRNFADFVNTSEDRIDILVNNAGVMWCDRSLTEEGIELHLGVNHMGHFLLTMLLLDKIKSSAPSRIVNISSLAHEAGQINFGDLNGSKDYNTKAASNQSKLANILFTVELADLLKGSGVTCNAVDPGITNTNILRHSSLGKSLFLGVLMKPLFWCIIKDARQGAQTPVYAAVSEELNDVTGQYLCNQKVSKAAQQANDRLVAKRLWAISERWTGLYNN